MNIMDNFADIDVDTLDLLGLNILNDPLVLTQEINGDIEHAEDTPPPLKECDDNDKIAERYDSSCKEILRHINDLWVSRIY